MIYLAKGRENCEVCGRFAWLMDVADTDCGPELWGAWCKRHAPRWAKEWFKVSGLPGAEDVDLGGPAPEIATQSAGGATEGTSCAASVQRSSP